MGYCLITGGGADGRYDIELDFGKAQKDAILAALATAINKNDLDILQTENDVAQAQAQEQALGLVLLQLQDTIATGTAQQKAEATIEYPKRATELAKLKAQNEPLRGKLRQLRFVRVSLRKQAQTFSLFQPIQRRQAWCADLTEDRAAGSYVGTIEVKGEPDLVLIQPGARGWSPTDGRVTGREIMSPWQAYWNAAVLPGWQKWKPTYRWGTLTAIDRGANTGNVALAQALSSSQRLGVNQSETLTNVPFRYMTCDNLPFQVADEVVVEFQAQAWASPRIIGFLTDPKPCDWVCIGSDTGGASLYFFKTDANTLASLSSPNLIFEVKWESRGWTTGYVYAHDTLSGAERYDMRADGPADIYDYPDPLFRIGAATIQVFYNGITRSGHELNGAPPGVLLTLMWPAAQFSNPFARTFAEFVLRKANNDLIFRAATNDSGGSGSFARANREAKADGGISLQAPFFGPVGVLDYTLTAT